MAEGAGFRIALATQGTRGDFQPMLALACGFQRAGHQVLIFGNPDHCKTASDFGFEAIVAAEEIKDVLQTEAGRRAMETGDLVAAMKGMNLNPEVDWAVLFSEGMERFRPDLIIYTSLIASQVTSYITRHPTVPALFAGYQPQLFPTSEFGPTSMYRVELEEGQPMMSKWVMHLNWQARMAMDAIIEAKERGEDPEVIENMLGPEAAFSSQFDWGDAPEPKLLAYSEAFWPAPSDWPKTGYYITGRWAISKDEQEARVQKGSSFFNVGSDLQRSTDFIKAGGPPVYIGWGSMTVYSNEHMAALAVGALRIAGQRGIIVAGWADVSADSLNGAPDADELKKYCEENVLFLKAAPHEWLFPQCSCCVHHGGIGTTQASLAAGSPTIVTPVFADQHDIALLITQRGWGLGTDRLPKVTAQDLGEAIKRVCGNQAMKASVVALAEKMGKEDGVRRTVDIVERFLCDDVKTGKWAERKTAWVNSVKMKRKKNERLTFDQISAQFSNELNKRYADLKAYNQMAMDRYTTLIEKAGAGKLWYVKGKSCLARAGEKLKSDEVGRYKEFAFLEVLEQKGSRLHVQRLKGVGPATGWVSTEVNGVEIVTKVASPMVMKLIAEEYTKMFADIS